MDGKRRLGILGRVDRVAAEGIAKRNVLGYVHLGVPHVVVAPLGAALAGGRGLEVRGVDERRLLQKCVFGRLVERGGIVAASPVSVNGEKCREGMATYKAMREETTTLFVPLAQMIARGLYVMVPPQAKPAQPMLMGATT